MYIYDVAMRSRLISAINAKYIPLIEKYSNEQYPRKKRRIDKKNTLEGLFVPSRRQHK